MCYLQWRTLSARATSVKRVADYKRHHSTLVYLVCRWIWRIFMTITTTNTYDIKIIPNCFWSLISSEPVIWLPPRRPDSKRFQNNQHSEKYGSDLLVHYLDLSLSSFSFSSYLLIP